ncbi:hypothetical protein KAT80_02615 [Candidatus Pacearchaeota archaeon]|nr:hypothetical protein [Candidatus Pacearchaeota archaeon]
MESKSESLERKLESPNWKQWLPVYGIYQVIKDKLGDKPTIIDFERGAGSFYGSAAYQAVSIAVASGGTIYGLHQLAEKLF